MHAGRYQIGDEISIPVLCKNAAGLPSDPDAAPTVRIYSTSALTHSGFAPILEPQATTGLFRAVIFLRANFAAGVYHILFTYKVGNHNGAEEKEFEVLPGGDARGQVISLYNYERPNASFLVSQNRSGEIYKGKNPGV